MDYKQKWQLLKRKCEKIFYAVLGKQCPVLDIEPGMEDQIGYTVEKPEIHLSCSNELFNDLEDDAKLFFISGVFAHELLHQAFSDFNLLKATISKYKSREKNIIAEINNIIEDPSIEYFAPTIIGGDLLKALRFSIFHIYKKSPDINECEEPYCQFLNALIQFGDMGLIKGYFTSEEAKKIFNQSVSLMNQAIKSPNPKERISIAEQIMELSRPLWERKTNAEFDELMKQIADQMNQLGKNQNEQSGSPMLIPDSDLIKEDNDNKQKQRNKTVSSLEKEKEENKESDNQGQGNNQKSNSEKQNSDSKSQGTEKSKEKDKSDTCSDDNSDSDNKSNSSESESNQTEKSDSSETSDNSEKSEDTENSSQSNNLDNSDNDSEDKCDTPVMHNGDEVRNTKESVSKNSNSQGSLPNIDFSENVKKDRTYDGCIDFSEYEITEEDIQNILKTINEEAKSQTKKELNDKSVPGEMDVQDISSGSLEGAKCLNKNITGGDVLCYQSLLSKNYSHINILTQRLKRIFDDDREERVYKTSGKINISRMNNGKITSRIFTKNIDPKNKANCSICLIIDESGSMSGAKAQAARDCAIILAETCKSLHIPIYIMGFTTGYGYDAVQNHYVKWKNSDKERITLSNICSHECNFDGYSIRYGGKLLEKRPEDYKLLIVISDGCPSHAINGIDAKKDVRNAVRDISKKASVLGISIQNNDYNTLHEFYGNNFIHLDDVEMLPIQFIGKIKKIIKDWE